MDRFHNVLIISIIAVIMAIFFVIFFNVLGSDSGDVQGTRTPGASHSVGRLIPDSVCADDFDCGVYGSAYCYAGSCYAVLSETNVQPPAGSDGSSGGTGGTAGSTAPTRSPSLLGFFTKFFTGNAVAGAGTIIYYNDGFVGIGTNNPSRKLEISSGFPQMRLTGDSPGIEFYSGSSYVGDISAGPTSAFSVRNNNQTFLITALQSGSVGVGTTSPAGTFTVKSTNPDAFRQGRQGSLTLFHNTMQDFVYDGGNDGSFIFSNTNATGYTSFQPGAALWVYDSDLKINQISQNRYITFDSPSSLNLASLIQVKRDGVLRWNYGSNGENGEDDWAMYAYGNNGEFLGVRLQIDRVTGSVKVPNLAGTYGGGSAYLCVQNDGTLFASDVACP